jgi:NADPH:quinone reductase
LRAMVCEQFGPPSYLTVKQLPDPPPKLGRLVVRVDAVGVGFVDGLMIQGKYQIKPPLPYVPGNEFCGTVVQVGEGVSRWSIGDRVMGLASGAFAEFLSLPATSCLEVPPTLTSPAAAGLLLNYATALYGLDDCGHLQSGNVVLVLGASGGVGSATIAVARAMGMQVIAGASTPEKVSEAIRFGAQSGVCYGQADWREDLKQVLAGRSLDAVIDPVGGAVADPALRSLSPGGRYLVVGFAAGSVPSIALNLVLLKRCSIVGVDWGGASRVDPTLTPRLAHKLFGWLNAGLLAPPPVDIRSLRMIRESLQAQLEGRISGKLVIDMLGEWPGIATTTKEPPQC